MSTELEALLSSTARVEILRLFLLNPDRQFYQREIERETGQPIRAVQREVERLGGIGLLIRTEEGNRVFYRLNPDFALLSELMALFQKAFEGEELARTPSRVRSLPPEPSSVEQPFAWMETPPAPSLPQALRRLQVKGEWDQSY
jgi:DNA-binding transcriptional ArsR family regulator